MTQPRRKINRFFIRPFNAVHGPLNLSNYDGDKDDPLAIRDAMQSLRIQ